MKKHGAGAVWLDSIHSGMHAVKQTIMYLFN